MQRKHKEAISEAFSFVEGEWIFNEGHIKVRNDQKYGAAEGKYPFTPTIARMDYPSMVGAPVIPEDEQKANVSLVLAAPELYEALEALDSSWLKTFPDGPDGEYNGVQPGDEHKAIWVAARAALAKAKGKA